MELTNPLIAFCIGLVIGIFVGFGILFLYKLIRDFILKLVSIPLIKHLQRENKILKEALNSENNLPMHRM